MTLFNSVVITKRHVVSYFQCYKEEFKEILMILDTQKNRTKDIRFMITDLILG